MADDLEVFQDCPDDADELTFVAPDDEQYTEWITIDIEDAIDAEAMR